jgi:hypothetical protein
MRIAVINENVSEITYNDLVKAVSAIQYQVNEHFYPVHGLTAEIKPFRSLEDVPVGFYPITIKYVIRNNELDGLHNVDEKGGPFGEIKFWKRWSYTLSHEILEMIKNPFLKEFRKSKSIFNEETENPQFVEEVADATDGKGYEIGGVEVSNFITPNWYDLYDNEYYIKLGTRSKPVKYDYLGILTKPRQLYEGGNVAWLSITNEYFQAQKTKGIVYLRNLTKNTPFEAITTAVTDSDNTVYYVSVALILGITYLIFRKK